MRVATIFGLLIFGIAALVVIPAATFGQPGGFQPGGKGGGKGGKGGMFDPNSSFDKVARGRPFFLISESRLRDSLTEFAKQKGITNGQITRAQYLEFSEQLSAKIAQGGGGMFKNAGGGPPISLPPGVKVFTPAQQQDPDTLNRYADDDFKRHDLNDDGKLNADEMPQALKDTLDRWDANMDGLIDILEYRQYFIARLKGSDADPNNKSGKKAVTIIIDEEDWDQRPTVLRAGKLHKDLPSWFKELDTDGDGQVALYEWRQGKKPLEEFRTWDTNDDGFITQEEALRLNQALTGKKPNPNPAGSSAASSSGTPGERPSFGPAGAGKGFGKGKKADRQP